MSNLDIELDEGIKDDEYLKVVEQSLQKINSLTFDFVFYVAGVDIHEDDRLGKFKVSAEGIKKRDELVIKHFFNKKMIISTL